MLKMIGLGVWLTAMSVCDIRKKSVPVWLFWVGAAMAGAMFLWESREEGLQIWSLVKALLPGAMLLLAAAAGKAGCADGLILMALGIAEGYPRSLFVCMIGLALAALMSGILLLAKKVRRTTKIPFVPFLEAGWLMAVWGGWG